MQYYMYLFAFFRLKILKSLKLAFSLILVLKCFKRPDLNTNSNSNRMIAFQILFRINFLHFDRTSIVNRIRSALQIWNMQLLGENILPLIFNVSVYIQNWKFAHKNLFKIASMLVGKFYIVRMSVVAKTAECIKTIYIEIISQLLILGLRLEQYLIVFF